MTEEQHENGKEQDMKLMNKQERYDYVIKELKRHKRMGWAANWSADWKRLKAEKVKLEKELSGV